MQLDLGSDPRSDVLRRAQAALIGAFGRIIRPPEKRRDPVWVLVQELEKMQDEAEESRRAMHEMKLKFDGDLYDVPHPAPVDHPDLMAILGNSCPMDVLVGILTHYVSNHLRIQ